MAGLAGLGARWGMGAATRFGREVGAEVAMNAATDYVSNKVKETTGYTYKSPPPNTVAGGIGAMAYTLGSQWWNGPK